MMQNERAFLNYLLFLRIFLLYFTQIKNGIPQRRTAFLGSLQLQKYSIDIAARIQVFLERKCKKST